MRATEDFVNTFLLVLAALAYLTGSASIVYGIFLLTGAAGGLISGGVTLLIFGYLITRGMNASG